MSLRPLVSPRLLVGAALLLPCVLQGAEVWTRGIDPDEFEHLHAAFCVHRGLVPYRDFFEHHGPLLYYFIQPLFWLCGEELTVLWSARLLMWFCSLGTLWLTARHAHRIAGEPAGLVAAALLAWTSIFHSKGIELRPDVPATLLLTLTALLAQSSERESGIVPWASRRWLGIGVLLALATLFTQKSIVPAAGLVLAAMARELIVGTRQGASNLGIAWFLTGFGMWCLTAMGFGLAGAGESFWESTVVRLWTWPIHGRTWEQLRPTLVADLTVWVAGLVGIVTAMRAFRQKETWLTGQGFVALSVAICIVSLTFIKAAFAQFYLLWFPLACVVAANQLVTWGHGPVGTRATMTVSVVALLLLAAQSAVWLRAAHLRDQGALSRLTALLPDGKLAIWSGAGVVSLCGAAALWWSVRRGKWAAVLALAAAFGMTHAALRNVDAFLWSHRNQSAAVTELHRHVAPDETVFDGFTGWGALRPHAFYYWWLNEYSLALLTPEERGPKLLAHLQAAPPAAVLFDRDLRRLPPEVTDWIEQNYRPVEPNPLWRPHQ